MAVRIRIDFLGETQIDRLLDGIADRVDDARPAFEVMGDRLAAAQTQQFDSEGAYGSGGWSPLSPTYAAWKAKNYPGQPILVRTGLLREAITQRPFGVDVIETRLAIFGPGVDYAPFHQQGTPRMPQRRVIELPDSERREWGKVMQRYLVTGSAT